LGLSEIAATKAFRSQATCEETLPGAEEMNPYRFISKAISWTPGIILGTLLLIAVYASIGWVGLAALTAAFLLGILFFIFTDWLEDKAWEYDRRQRSQK
jgi:hypothetical protein